MPKIVKGTLWDFLTTILLQIIKKLKGDTLVQSKNLQKSLSAEKNRSEKHQDSQRGSLVCF